MTKRRWRAPATWPEARRVTGAFWHHGPPGRPGVAVADPATTEGRYHELGGAGAWYASGTEAAMWAEFDRHFLLDGVDPTTVFRRAGTYRVDIAVLDLTDDAVLDDLGLDAKDLVGDDYALPQAVAHGARQAGYQGILAPSAALPGTTTLVAFTDGARKVRERNVVVTRRP